jgi:hypothetical protein
MDVLDIEENPAAKQCQRWMMHGFVERIKKGKYRKLLKEILV